MNIKVSRLHSCSDSGALPLSSILVSGPILISHLSSFLPSHIFFLADQNEPLEQWINHPFPSGRSHLEWNNKLDSFRSEVESTPAGKAPALYTGNEWLSKPDMGTTYKLKPTPIQGTILKDKPQPSRKTNLSQFPRKLHRKIPYCVTKNAETSTNHSTEHTDLTVSSHTYIQVHRACM